MTKLRMVSDDAERRVKGTVREIAFAIALTVAAAISLYAASIHLPSETALNEASETSHN